MTPRSLGYVALKLMGLYFGLSALLQLVAAFGYLGLSPEEGFPSVGAIVTSSFAAAAALALFSAVCLVWTGPLSESLFPAEPSVEVGAARRDLLTVGLVLLGVYIAVNNAPEVLRFAIEAFWYLGGERRELFPGFLAQSWQSLFNSAILVILGLALVFRADRLVKVTEGRESQTP